MLHLIRQHEGVSVFAIAALFVIGCGPQAPPPAAEAPVDAQSELIPGYNHLRDSLLKDPRIPPIVRSYMMDGRTIVLLDRLFAEEDQLIAQPFADIDGDHTMDSVLVMPEGVVDSTTWSEGQSFVFTDRRFGKLRSPEPGCNHVPNMFLLDDIDEDGMHEVGLYTSSCASRYKAVRVFTLRPDTTWHELGSITFDIHCPEPPKEARVRKLSKGSFEMLRVECEGAEGQVTVERWEPRTLTAR